MHLFMTAPLSDSPYAHVQLELLQVNRDCSVLSIDSTPCVRACMCSSACYSSQFLNSCVHDAALFEVEEAKKLRVAVGSFLDLITLIIDTMDQFG